MRRLAILGASGHGKVVADAAELSGWEAVTFFDDAWPSLLANGAWKVDGNSGVLMGRLADFDGVTVAIGHNSVRLSKLVQLQNAGAPVVVIKHPSAIVSSYSVIESGSVIFAHAVVNAGAHVGMGTILNTACTIDHDCHIGEGVHISPGAHLAGGVQVEELTWVGIGASIRQSIKIGTNVIVGAGAVVVNDIAEGTTVVGVPAKALSY